MKNLNSNILEIDPNLIPSQSVSAKIEANIQELFETKLTSGESYIRLKITPEISTFLAMEKIQESLIIGAERISPIPNMPESFIGIMNSRDRVFSVFDLALLLKLPTPLFSPREYQVVVLETQSAKPIYIAFAVEGLQGMIRLAKEQISTSMEQVPAELAPFALGCIHDKESVVPLIEFGAILDTLNPLGYDFRV